MRWILVGMLGLVAPGCRGDAQRCAQACRNYGNLVYGTSADLEATIAAAPPDQRDALRQQKQADLAQRLELHVGICVSQCTSIDDPKTVDCMIAARTADQALACAK